jgi:hypothetical protein
MKKKLYLITTILLSAAALSLSSCLKDNRYVDFSKGSNVVDFATQTFGSDAITETPDTDANGTIVRQFAINVATVNPPKTATTVTLAVDNSLVTSYDAANPSVTYLPMPTNAYKFTATSVTVPAGQQYATVSVTFYKNLLDPAKSYMLPIKIVSAPGFTISGNQGVHYYHFIGNDFAGSYDWHYTRFNSTDTTTAASPLNADEGLTTVFPVTPTQFEVASGYLYQARYEVTFTKTGNGPTAMYSNFNVTLNADDVASELTAYPVASGGPITVTVQPEFLPTSIANKSIAGMGTPTLAGPFTYAQALTLFRFSYGVANSVGGTRTFFDQYTKQ